MFNRAFVVLALLAMFCGATLDLAPLAAQEFAPFRTPSGMELKLRVEPDRMYRAHWSRDLETWLPLGDLFLPDPDTHRLLPDEAQAFGRLDPGPRIDELEPLVVIIGDSTVANLSPISPSHHGWGQVIQDFFQPIVRVVNLAEGGVGTRRFFQDGRINHVNRLEPDIVIIQFGHIDFREKLPLPEYEENLSILIRAIRRIDAIPVLVTPVARRLYDDQGRLLHELAQRRMSVMNVSQRDHVALIDLNGRSAALYNRLVPEQSPILTVCGDACTDQSHFSRVGAYVMASLATRDFPPVLRGFTVPLDDLIPKVEEAFTYIQRFKGFETPFIEISGGFQEDEIWEWIYPEIESSSP
jgi:lysophospholipase L1-like esterase